VEQGRSPRAARRAAEEIRKAVSKLNSNRIDSRPLAKKCIIEEAEKWRADLMCSVRAGTAVSMSAANGFCLDR
jgi:hypothetical protein